MALLFANNAASKLASPITGTATTIVLQSGGGTAFPTIAIGSGNTFLITVTSATSTTVKEIMLVTARTGDTMTVVRSQEGSSASPFLAGDDVEQLITAGTMNALIQSPASVANGGTGVTATPTNGQLLIGNGSGFNLATLTGGTGITVTNTAGGISIAATGAAVPSGTIVLWYGTFASIPAGWVLCDGNPSTGAPDLRDRFVIGAGSTYNPGDTGGSSTLTVAIGATSLTQDQIAPHTHLATASDGGHTHSVYDPGHFHTVGENTPSVLGGPNVQYTFGNTTTTTVNPAVTNVAVQTGYANVSVGIASSGGGQPHTHTVTTGTNLPPFRALAYIMKL